jgi:hypothetical protein
MLNYLMRSADRTTHLKIVVVALLAATLVAGVGVAARASSLDTEDELGRIKFMGIAMVTDVSHFGSESSTALVEGVIAFCI